MIWDKAMEFLLKTVTSTKEILRITLEMVLESLFYIMVITSRESFSKISYMVKENSQNKMVMSTTGILN